MHLARPLRRRSRKCPVHFAARYREATFKILTTVKTSAESVVLTIRWSVDGPAERGHTYAVVGAIACVPAFPRTSGTQWCVVRRFPVGPQRGFMDDSYREAKFYGFGRSPHDLSSIQALATASTIHSAAAAGFISVMVLHSLVVPTSPLPHQAEPPPLTRSPSSLLGLTESQKRRRKNMSRASSNEPTVAGGLSNWRRQPKAGGIGTGTGTTGSGGTSEKKKRKGALGMGMQGTPAKRGKRSHSKVSVNARDRVR